jgi:CPA2 family monovalent cation:H+ antiporter-2
VTHLPNLIRDLAFILITGAFVSIIFKKLKQPVVLGYLIAGFFLGPNFPFFFNIKETSSISVFAELGVIFLLFGLGLEFSFKKLSRIGKSSGIAALFETFIMFSIGYGIGYLFNWKTTDCLYLGGMIAISSTTIIVKAFEDLNLKGRDFVHLVFGILIVEDLIAILFLVILTSIGVTNSFSVQILLVSVLKLVFFITIWFLVGIYLIPLILKKISSHLNDESIIIISIGLCLLMVVIATQLGFSAALGAFVMGSILSETKDGKKIEHLFSPIQKLFSVVFFVSVGMMINTSSIVTHYSEIFIIAVAVIIGKIISVTIGSLLAGEKIHKSISAGFSLAQIGEFSFIVATLGMTMKVTSNFLYPIAVIVSAITTFTTPFLIKSSHLFYQKIDLKLPQQYKNRLEKYHYSMTAKGEKGTLSLLWNAYGVRIILNIILVIAITLFFKQSLLPNLLKIIPDNRLFQLLSATITLLCTAPFLWAIFLGNPTNSIKLKASNLVKLKNLLLGITIFRIFLGVILIIFLISQFTEIYKALSITLSIVILGIILNRNIFEKFYLKIENRFMSNLNEQEKEILESNKYIPRLAPWNAILVEAVVSPTSHLCGKSLQDSMLRKNFNVTVAFIERGTKHIMAPNKNEFIMSYDRLHLIGTEEELTAAKAIIEESSIGNEINENDVYYNLESVILSKKSIFINKSIKDCGLREKINGLIIGIEREGIRILNPDSTIILKVDDLLWVVGDIRKINKLE